MTPLDGVAAAFVAVSVARLLLAETERVAAVRVRRLLLLPWWLLGAGFALKVVSVLGPIVAATRW
jgi:hypothetical protein